MRTINFPEHPQLNSWGDDFYVALENVLLSLTGSDPDAPTPITGAIQLLLNMLAATATALAGAATGVLVGSYPVDATTGDDDLVTNPSGLLARIAPHYSLIDGLGVVQTASYDYPLPDNSPTLWLWEFVDSTDDEPHFDHTTAHTNPGTDDLSAQEIGSFTTLSGAVTALSQTFAKIYPSTASRREESIFNASNGHAWDADPDDRTGGSFSSLDTGLTAVPLSLVELYFDSARQVKGNFTITNYAPLTIGFVNGHKLISGETLTVVYSPA